MEREDGVWEAFGGVSWDVGLYEWVAYVPSLKDSLSGLLLERRWKCVSIQVVT